MQVQDKEGVGSKLGLYNPETRMSNLLVCLNEEISVAIERIQSRLKAESLLHEDKTVPQEGNEKYKLT